MPYITEDRRQEIDSCDHLILPDNADVGDLNYIFTRYCNAYLKKWGLRYYNVNAVIGMLECVKLELYRRIAAPYEDAKKDENGDVYDV